MKLIKKFFNRIIEWLDERFSIKGTIEKNLTKKMIPKGMKWFGCFGGMAFVALLLQVGSGIFLAINYIPSLSEAFNSIQYIKHSIPYGWLIQKIHAVGPNIIVAFVSCHMARIIFKAAYKKPRELHWVSGVVLFILTFLICYTGSFLPANQMTYWGINTMAKAAESPTMVANYDVGIWGDGDRFSAHKFMFIYAMHIIGIPVLIVAFMVLHFVMIRRTGIDEPF